MTIRLCGVCFEGKDWCTFSGMPPTLTPIFHPPTHTHIHVYAHSCCEVPLAWILWALLCFLFVLFWAVLRIE